MTAVQESHDLGTRWPETQDRLIITLPYLEDVDVNLTELSPGEEAVAKTLRGWGAELDNDQKFWWADCWWPQNLLTDGQRSLDRGQHAGRVVAVSTFSLNSARQSRASTRCSVAPSGSWPRFLGAICVWNACCCEHAATSPGQPLGRLAWLRPHFAVYRRPRALRGVDNLVRS